MPSDKDGSVRKVFTLPVELAERVAAFQSARRLGSEVEAVQSS